MEILVALSIVSIVFISIRIIFNEEKQVQDWFFSDLGLGIFTSLTFHTLVYVFKWYHLILFIPAISTIPSPEYSGIITLISQAFLVSILLSNIFAIYRR